MARQVEHTQYIQVVHNVHVVLNVFVPITQKNRCNIQDIEGFRDREKN